MASKVAFSTHPGPVQGDGFPYYRWELRDEDDVLLARSWRRFDGPDGKRDALAAAEEFRKVAASAPAVKAPKSTAAAG